MCTHGEYQWLNYKSGGPGTLQLGALM